MAVPEWASSILGLLALFTISLAAGLALLTAWTIHRLLHPPRRTYATALAQGRPGQPDQVPGVASFETWPLTWRGMPLPVWDFPGAGGPAAPVFILSHGWGDSRIGALTRAQALLPLASRFVAWDMPGHGDSPDHSPCLLGAHEHLALRALIERLAQEPAPVVLLGWSLGAGVSIAAMSGWNTDAARNVRAIIAEAPYRLPQTPARNMLRSFGLPHAINLPLALAVARHRTGAPPFWDAPEGTFDRAALARSLPCPLLVLHGDQDAIAPIEDGRAIVQAAPDARLQELQGLGHYSIWTGDHTSVIMEHVREFVGEAVGART